MRITFDTNVLVSAFIAKHGHPRQLLELTLTLEQAELVLSESILNEFEKVLMRPEVKRRFMYTPRDVKTAVNALRKTAEIVRLKSTFRVMQEDPEDNVILTTAYDGNSEYIVSDDSHLLRLRKFKRIKITNPKQMIEIITHNFPEFVFHF